ncbi:MAG: TonB-dependent receptor [Phenylobacterium sp.]|uniref:TonB-dependent receptor n=1 Tax=Phenylobacterium sp. TaxID=1871053 RepID=UPI002A367E89|nr:TonB-dependent receptor [Phenylobacterium sp.]MDX9997427.1 TonB-dependent receptor [Phenylobacterium sp.]
MPADLPPPTVEAVVVQPPRLPPLAGEAVFAVQELGVEALKAEPRLDAALRAVPGVSLFRRTGSDAANPTIQGLSLRAIAPSGAGRALVMLDGAPQNDPFGGWVIWSSLPPESLAAVRVVRGAGAGPYGAGALTGVVALTERPTGGGLQALEAFAGERESARLAIAGGDEHLFLAVAGSTSAGYTPVRAGAGGADAPTTLHDFSASARLQGELLGGTGALRVGVYEERRGAGLVGARSVASGASAALTLARSPGQDESGWRVQAWLRSSDLKNSSAAVAAGRASTTPANDQYATPALGWGLNAAWQGRSGPWSWEIGADARFTDGEVRERFRFMDGGFNRHREAGGKTRVAGLYGEAAYAGEDLVLTGGVRVDGWASSEALRRERDLATGQVLLDASADGAEGTTPTARLGARWRLGGEVFLRGAAYAGFRPPTLNELHRPFRVGNDITEANASLEPERLYGIEAGLLGEAPVRWSATVFHNRLEDPITNVTIGFGPATFPVAGFVPAGGVLRQRRNVGVIEATGVELDAAAELSERLSLRAALGATRARVDGGSAAPQLTGKRPAQTPELTVTAGADWRPVELLRLSADLRYESARFEDDLNLRKLSPAVLVDLRAAWRVSETAEVYVAADNLFDAEVEIGETADGIESFAAPRMLRVGFSLRR